MYVGTCIARRGPPGCNPCNLSPPAGNAQRTPYDVFSWVILPASLKSGLLPYPMQKTPENGPEK